MRLADFIFPFAYDFKHISPAFYLSYTCTLSYIATGYMGLMLENLLHTVSPLYSLRQNMLVDTSINVYQREGITHGRKLKIHMKHFRTARSFESI